MWAWAMEDIYIRITIKHTYQGLSVLHQAANQSRHQAYSACPTFLRVHTLLTCSIINHKAFAIYQEPLTNLCVFSWCTSVCVFSFLHPPEQLNKILKSQTEPRKQSPLKAQADQEVIRKHQNKHKHGYQVYFMGNSPLERPWNWAV